jgi:hypothetical protein
MEYSIVKGTLGVEERHTLQLTDEDGNVLVRVLAPVGWNASTFAQARVANTMRGMVEPQDYDSVPAGCVMELAVRIAGEKLRDLAVAREELGNARKALIAEQQKVQALTNKLHLYVSALVRAAMTWADAEKDLHPGQHGTPGQCAEVFVQRLYQAVDRMNPKPESVQYLVEVIRKTGEAWK